MGIIGLGLLVGTWIGRSRGLIVAGILLVPLLAVSPLAELDLSNLTRVVYAPETVADIQPVYSGDLASMVIDFSQVDFEGETVAVDVNADLGEVVVVVPTDTAVIGRARVDLGAIDLFDRATQGGIGTISTPINRAGSRGTLDLEVNLGGGRILITADPDDPRIEDAPLASSGGAIVIDEIADIDERYEIGAGSLVFDLTGLDLTQGANLRVQLGAGELVILVAPGTPLDVEASAGVGEIVVGGRSDSGFAPRLTFTDPDALLELDLSVGAGSITVKEQS